MKRDFNESNGNNERVRKILRGRAEKACVRCRAKKRTCDGGNPCLRCKESHSACYFSDWHYTVPYPREYVEFLEEQQEQLSTGLMTMYQLMRDSDIRALPALPERPQAQDLLKALKGVRLDGRPHNSFLPSCRCSNPSQATVGPGIPMEELSSGRDIHGAGQQHSPPGMNSMSLHPPSMFMSLGPTHLPTPTLRSQPPLSTQQGYPPAVYPSFPYATSLPPHTPSIRSSHVNGVGIMPTPGSVMPTTLSPGMDPGVAEVPSGNFASLGMSQPVAELEGDESQPRWSPWATDSSLGYYHPPLTSEGLGNFNGHSESVEPHGGLAPGDDSQRQH